MEASNNPFAIGFGSTPAGLIGRDHILETARIAIERVRRGRHSQSQILVGLRGVGKTVLLDAVKRSADQAGYQTVRIEAPEHKSLPALLAPQLRTSLIRMSRFEQAKEMADRAQRALAGFVSGLRVRYDDIEVGLDLPPEPGLADNGDLESDLAVLIEQVGLTAQAADTVVVLLVDELQ